MGFSFAEEREKREKLKDCKTVEEVEALRCNECARDGKWGWCDSPWIDCDFKTKIKEILGKKDYTFKTLAEQMPQIVKERLNPAIIK